MGEGGALADAGTGQRGAGLGVGGVAGQDAPDRPAAVPAGEVGAEQALETLVVRRALVAAGGGDIGVRGAQFAEDLPEQVGEVVRGGDPFDQRPVLGEDRVPVDAAHVRLPEEGAGQPPGLLVRLPPLGARVDPVQDAAGVDPGGGVAVAGLGGGHGAQVALVEDDEPGAVAADREPVEVVDQFGLAGLGGAEVLQGGPFAGVVRVGEGLAERAGDRPAQPDQAAVGDRVQRGVLGRGDRERRHPARQPLDLDGDRADLAGPVLHRVGTAGGRAALRVQGERGGGGRGERDQVGAAAQREGEVAGVHVVDRVEAAPGEEGEVAAVAGEDRVLVLEAAVGDVDDDRAVPPVDPGHLDLPQGAADTGVGPGQPAAVRGEGEVAHGAVDGPDQLGHSRAAGTVRAGLRAVVRAVSRAGVRTGVRDVEQQQPAVVRGDRQSPARRVGDRLQHPAQPPGGQPARLPAAGGPGQVGDLHGVLAAGVGDAGDPAAPAEHLRQPDPDPGGVGEGAGGTVPVGEPVQAAAHHHRAGPARLVHGDAVDVLGGGHLVGTQSRAGAVEPDVQAARPGVRREVVDDPQLARALVDHAGAVARRVPGVEGVVVGVPAQAGAVVRARVQVADALVVGEEGDPAAGEQGGVQMPAEPFEEPLTVQPEPAGGAAPVALPGGGLVRRGAGEQQGAALAAQFGDLEVGDRAPGQLAARVAVARDLVRPGQMGERLALRGDGEHRRRAVRRRRRPAADPGVERAPVGELPPRPARRGHQVHLGQRAVPAGEREMPAVR
ncbi:hypothetical protein Sdagh_54190 [Streptomyces daghestanicus]|uniref:Uncharacterized protein n=1 Tax=Streptomyces daghestanicus TaxID=66885 RepID=A0ABQ3Q8Q9_9ACTN|nr:hypothetical protein Sdagh_54190 [Streptomyces daghestanicus]